MMDGTHGMIRQEEGKRHMDRDTFCDWLAGRMEPGREEAFLGHIGNCTFCAGQFAAWMEAPPEASAVSADLSQEPPRYLKEEILQRTQQMDVQVSVHVKEKSRQMQLFVYSLKVGLAVMTSIFLLMLTSSVMDTDPGALHTWKLERMQKRQESVGEMPSITDTLNQKSGEVSSFLNEISNGWFRMDWDHDDQEVTR